MKAEAMERIERLMREDGIESKAELARRLGISDQIIGNWGRRGPSSSGALDVERCLGWRALYIIDGELPERIRAAPSPYDALRDWLTAPAAPKAAPKIGAARKPWDYDLVVRMPQ